MNSPLLLHIHRIKHLVALATQIALVSTLNLNTILYLFRPACNWWSFHNDFRTRVSSPGPIPQPGSKNTEYSTCSGTWSSNSRYSLDWASL